MSENEQVPVRTMKVVLEIDVADLTEAARKALNDGADGELDTLEFPMPRLADTSAGEAANVLDAIGMEGFQGELFAGSDTYVRYVRSEVMSAEWKGPSWLVEEPKP